MKYSAEKVSYGEGDAVVTANVLYLNAKLGKQTSEGKTKGKGTIFYRYEVEVLMPNGDTRVVDAQLWKGSLDKFADKFVLGANITLEVQTDGDFKGRAKIQLPKMRAIDVDAFLGTTEDTEEVSEVEEVMAEA